MLLVTAVLLFGAFLLMTECVRNKRLSQLEELGRTPEKRKKLKRQMLIVRICSLVALAAGILYPLLLVVFPDIIVFLIAAGIATAASTVFVELVD